MIKLVNLIAFIVVNFWSLVINIFAAYGILTAIVKFFPEFKEGTIIKKVFAFFGKLVNKQMSEE